MKFDVFSAFLGHGFDLVLLKSNVLPSNFKCIKKL